MRLARREKLLLAAVGALVVLALGYHLVVKPALQRAQALERVQGPKSASLAELRALSREYVTLKGQIEGLRRKIEQQPEGFGVLSFLEGATDECGIADKVSYMHPSTAPLDESYVEHAVEVKVEGVTLAQLVRFLVAVPSADAVLGVKSLRIEVARNAKLLDAVVVVTALESAA